MSVSLDWGAWLQRQQPNPAARLRLFCLPYAGGGASVFRTWADGFESEVDVCPIALPGRERRLREPPYSEPSELVPLLAHVLRPVLDLPFALFGQSLGAGLMFELARELRRLGNQQPVLLAVAARRAPQLPEHRQPLHRLPDDQLVAELSGRYGGIPQAIRDEPSMMRIFLPILRSDLALSERLTYRHEAPLACPLSVFGGLEDGEVSRADLAAWGTRPVPASPCACCQAGTSSSRARASSSWQRCSPTFGRR
jgi:medium-chain acyl-[acyl-carrier-protein] hydrolase